MHKEPLFTIVIVNYNYGRFLKDAIQSVLSQSCQDFELIVVDGGSTDNSVEIIQTFSDRVGGARFGGWDKVLKFASSKVLNSDESVSTTKNAEGTENVQHSKCNIEHRINNFRTPGLQNSRTRFLWCSEPDKGQSDAFNKGFAHASGRFLTWLNSDDVFFPRALEHASKAICKHPDCEWFAGGCFWLGPKLHVMKCSCARTFSHIRAKRGEISVWAPSSFFSKALFDRVGGVDADFHYMMDTELWFRFYRQAGAVYRPIKGYCWGLRLHPDAKMSGHNFESSEHSQQSHPKWKQMREEGEIFNSRYGAPKNNGLTKWFTTSPLVFLRNKFDTWRFCGKPVGACFKTPG